MTLTSIRLACISLACIAMAAPCLADSVASSASSAGSASSASLSDSIDRSSDSSRRDKQVAEGDYRIVEVAAVADRPGMLQLKMRPTAAQGEAREFTLDLPQPTFEHQGLAPGAIVSARHRAYGLEFARVDTYEPFFLVLADDWQHQLESHAVTL